uniref:CSON001544 protein n=1 Tax=Culicoides sonorensis TaxID=179676 RepID=A0A336MI52_CULSO
MMGERPRLTRTMRSFTDLDAERDLAYRAEEKRKLQMARANQSKKGMSWKSLNLLVKNETHPDKVGALNAKLHEVWNLSKELIGSEESPEVIDDAAVFLVRLFLDQKLVLLKHLTEMKKIFGPFSNQLANKICKVVYEASDEINDKIRSKLLEEEIEENESTRKSFKIPYEVNLPKQVDQDTSFLKDLTPVPIGAQSIVAQEFTMKFDNKKVKPKAVPSNSNKTPEIEKYSLGWLSKHCNPDLLSSLINLIKTPKSNEELQGELFDMMGFDKFEEIQEILNNRRKIVQKLDAHEKNEVVMAKEKSKVGIQPHAPSYLIPAVVHTDKEKKVLKQIRKEEKKVKRIENGTTEDSDRSNEVNPAQLRLNLQKSYLNTLVSQPILQSKPKSSSTKSATRYPHVYDSYANAKAHIGFLAGGKVILPENAERHDTRMYEEVRIPANDPPPLDVGQNRIKISQLDEIGQIAFKGTKELNRIQTVVYPTAYHSNENLLICAPTGAGKTNVAMLTIVRTIRAHADQGVIHRDAFKIVYVAPMKALAAEMTSNFSKKLAPLGIIVRELTGDMQLTKTEMAATQILVTTPEKWDVVTRKGSGDVALVSLVKLLIIDEVHLLHGERGPVVEALVARTLRLVESSQSMIRIVGLSATLPNYLDVARFLGVNPMIGLFYFDSRFRPIPLSTQFIGVKTIKPLQQMQDMDQICFDKCVEMVRQGHQVMVFVHARNATVRTATTLREMAQQKGLTGIFACDSSPEYGNALKAISKSRNRQLVDLFQSGLAMHHAGMLRPDRNLVEKYFSDGLIKVLVCTATLAWGVNLPAHAVIIRGTEIYDAKHGSFVDLGILDVLQIFGRAGRPQFDSSGVGIILTTYDKLNHYLSLLTNQFPIESNFVNYLSDNLNAEITLGTISNVEEAITWLSYTYLYVRMRINPQVYGLNYNDVYEDPSLEKRRRELIHNSAMALDKAKMIRYNVRTGDLNVTDLGRTASHFYIKYDTVEIFNEILHPIMNEGEILNMVACASEFHQLKVRDDELDELDDLSHEFCHIPIKGGSENIHGKVNILMQAYLSRGFVKSFSLTSDLQYINQNAVRIVRALFTIVLRQNNALLAARLLMISKMFEHQMWDFMTPLRQFPIISYEMIDKIESRRLSVTTLREMTVNEISDMLRNQKFGTIVSRCAFELPLLEIEATIHPITRTVLRIRIHITPDFKWNDRVHGKNVQSFWIWIEDPESNFIYHSEYFQVSKKQVVRKEPQELVMTIPLKDPLPPQYYIRAISDTWLGSSNVCAISFKHLILPELHPPHTELLPINPLPKSVLNDHMFESLYTFDYFNPIQTQIFHCLYHTDNNVLLGAPTGSGKTIAAEVAMFRVFKNYPKAKVVYIAPLKALVKERIDDWKVRLEQRLGKRVVELTGDVTPDARAIRESTVIVTTPEKWDGISRSWQTRDYVKDVALIVIDEIHLLGEDRGPVLEVIVSRTNFIASHTTRTLRIVGLSTALANARDLADWLGIKDMGLYNFKPSVRPVPLAVHISGYPGKHYCPRMATMNRPAYQAIRQYSPCTPALIFVSSRRQTRLTALDLIAFLASEDNPKQFAHIPDNEMEQILVGIKDTNLKLTLAFGIGLHHAGLQERDRKTVEELFLNRKIQVLIATATLAWGVNLPAHLVIIKGTEYYDGKLKRYVDMPITDVLQMMGRAGRPQFGNEGVACVLVHDAKKNFYKKFLYDPFPVESSLLAVLPDHINAEIVAGTVQTKQAVLDYFTWTYFFRRLLRNPTYYNLESVEPEQVNHFLMNLVEDTVDTLHQAGCVEIGEDNRTLYPTSMGRISSYYYLSYQSMRHFADNLRETMSFEEVMKCMCDSYEFYQHPVRHNEDKYNEELGKSCRYKPDALTYDSPYTKVFLLLQAHFSHLPLPNADFLTDTKSVLDQAIRIQQAMIDIAAEKGWLVTTLRIQQLMQCTLQARWFDDPVVMCLPHIEDHNADLFDRIKLDHPVLTLPTLKEKVGRNYEALATALRGELDETQIEHIYKVIQDMPSYHIDLYVRGYFGNQDDEQKRIEKQCSKNDWLDVHSGMEYILVVDMCRLGRMDSKYIYSPKFPKPKDEGWFLTLGCIEDRELLALKRAGYRGNKSSHQVCFTAPEKLGRVIYTLYIMSDGYLGWDQQYNLQLNVIRKPNSTMSDDYEIIKEKYGRLFE